MVAAPLQTGTMTATDGSGLRPHLVRGEPTDDVLQPHAIRGQYVGPRRIGLVLHREQAAVPARVQRVHESVELIVGAGGGGVEAVAPAPSSPGARERPAST